MKNKFKASICLILCFAVAFTCFAACKSDEENTSTTTLPVNDSWESGTGYEKVTISQAELADLIKDALGDELGEDFSGDINDLTDEQLQALKDKAEDKGYSVGTDENGNTYFEKEDVPTTKVDKEEESELINDVLGEDFTGNLNDLTPDQLDDLDDKAEEEGYDVVTTPEGNVEIVKPVTTTKIITQTSSTSRAPITTTKNRTPSTTSVFVPQGATINQQPTIVTTVAAKLTSSWLKSYSGGNHTVLAATDGTSDGGCVAVGITTTETGSSGTVVKFDASGKQVWAKVLEADLKANQEAGNASTLVSFDDVAVLDDGSIIVVGSTMAIDLASPDDYPEPGTVEAIVVKYDASGNKKWLKIFGGSGSDMFYSVEATPDGGFVAGGKSTSPDHDFSGLNSNYTKAFVFKFNASGDIKWKYALGGKIHCSVVSLTVNSSGEIFAALENNNGDGDFASIEGSLSGRRTSVTVKLSKDGKKQWTNGLYETGRVETGGITVSEDGGCVVAVHYSVSPKEGNSYSFKSIYNGGTAGTFDTVLVKYKADGTRSWICPIIGFENDIATDVVKIKNGYAVTGYSASNNRDFQGMGSGDFDSYVYTVSNYGKMNNLYHFGGSNADNARGICLSGSNVIVCGSTNSSDVSFNGISPAPSSNKAVGFVRSYKAS